MKLFIDTGSVAEVEEIAAWGVLSGATTNPTLLAKEPGDPAEIIARICELVDGPVSAEVVSDETEGMVTEGRALAGLHRHVVVKVPFSEAGLAATRELASDGIRVNMTLVFSAAQALLAAVPTAIVLVAPIPAWIEELRARGQRLVSLAFPRRAAPWLLPGTKSVSYATHVAAEAEARRRGQLGELVGVE